MSNQESRDSLHDSLKQKRCESRGWFRERELTESGVLDQRGFYERRRQIDVTLRLEAEPFRDSASYAGYDRKHSVDAYHILAVSSQSGARPTLAEGNYVVLEVPPEQGGEFVSGDVVRIRGFTESQFGQRGLFVNLIVGNGTCSVPIEWVKAVVEPADRKEPVPGEGEQAV